MPQDKQRGNNIQRSQASAEDEQLAQSPQEENDLLLMEDFLESFLNPSEAEETVSDFIYEWAQGNFEDTLDLLAHDSALREGLTDEEWLARREQWFKAAQPDDLKVAFVHERPGDDQQQSHIVDAGWSLVLNAATTEPTPAELPKASVSYAPTRRYWFWSSYTLVEQDEEFLIQNMTDEGTSAQNLPEQELKRRIEELKEQTIGHMEQLMPTATGTDEEAQMLDDSAITDLVGQVQEAIRVTVMAMHYNDGIIAQSPANDPEVYQLAYEQAETVQDHERAAAYMQLQAEHMPDHRAEALRNLAVALFSMGEASLANEDPTQANDNFVQAEKMLRESLSLEQNTLSSILLAQTLLSQEKNIDEAERLLQQASADTLEPREETLVESGLARIATEREQPEQALQHYLRVAELTPDFPGVWFNIGYFQRALNQPEAAEQSFLRSVETEPTHLQAYLELASMYMSTADGLPKAQEILEQGVEVDPESVELLAMLALTYAQQGNANMATRLLEEAETIDPESEIVQVVRQIVQNSKAKKSSSGKPKSRFSKKRK